MKLVFLVLALLFGSHTISRQGLNSIPGVMTIPELGKLPKINGNLMMRIWKPALVATANANY